MTPDPADKNKTTNIERRWWTFAPENGWQTCAEREAMILLNMLKIGDADLEGCKVVQVDVRIDLAVIARMRRPTLLVCPQMYQQIKASGEVLGSVFDAFPRLRIQVSEYLPDDGMLTFIDAAAL